MSIRKVKTKTGEIKWQVRIHESGRGSKRINRRFDRRVDAEDFVTEIEKSLKDQNMTNPRGSTPSERTFREEWAFWLQTAKADFSAAHIKRMQDVFDEIAPKYGDWTLEKFTPDFLTRCQQLGLQKGLKNSTINRDLQIFTTILNFSFEKRRIAYNPILGFSKLREIQPEMSFLDLAEARSFLRFTSLKYPKGSPMRWVYVVYLTALNTALRGGELWGLMPIDVSRDALRITVRRQFNVITKELAPPKGKKSRIVPCNHELKNELLNLILQNNITNNETIFMNEVRKPICHNNFVKRRFNVDLKEWCATGVGRKIRFHDLRHTAATLLISNGVDLRTTKDVCGHASIKTTMIYAHLVDANIDKAALTFSVGGEEDASQTV